MPVFYFSTKYFVEKFDSTKYFVDLCVIIFKAVLDERYFPTTTHHLHYTIIYAKTHGFRIEYSPFTLGKRAKYSASGE